MGAVFARPTKSVLSSATVTLQSGTENPSYPLAGLYDGRTDFPFKATGTSIIIRAAYGAPRTLQGVSIPVGHNLHGLSGVLSNNGGMSNQSLVMPAVGEDGVSLGGWADLRGISGATATQWELEFTGAAAPIAIGELMLLEEVESLRIVWGADYGEQHSIIEHTLESGVKLRYDRGIRFRSLSGTVVRESDRAALTRLHREARGPMLPWWLVPDEDVNDAMAVRFAEERRRFTKRSRAQSDQPIQVEELIAGIGY